MLKLRRTGINPQAGYMSFVAGKVALGLIFRRDSPFPVSFTVPSMVHVCIYPCTIDVDIVTKQSTHSETK